MKNHCWLRDRRRHSSTWHHCMDCGTERVMRPGSPVLYRLPGDSPDDWTTKRPACERSGCP